jgi:hypothetical protein
VFIYSLSFLASSFVQRIDNRMTIETINYYSIRVRQKLEKELDIDLVDLSMG